MIVNYISNTYHIIIFHIQLLFYEKYHFICIIYIFIFLCLFE